MYVARNPKDMIVSYFHHNRLLKTQGYIRDFPTYWNYFERDLCKFKLKRKKKLNVEGQVFAKNLLFHFSLALKPRTPYID